MPNERIPRPARLDKLKQLQPEIVRQQGLPPAEPTYDPNESVLSQLATQGPQQAARRIGENLSNLPQDAAAIPGLAAKAVAGAAQLAPKAVANIVSPRQRAQNKAEFEEAVDPLVDAIVGLKETIVDMTPEERAQAAKLLTVEQLPNLAGDLMDPLNLVGFMLNPRWIGKLGKLLDTDVNNLDTGFKGFFDGELTSKLDDIDTKITPDLKKDVEDLIAKVDLGDPDAIAALDYLVSSNANLPDNDIALGVPDDIAPDKFSMPEEEFVDYDPRDDIIEDQQNLINMLEDELEESTSTINKTMKATTERTNRRKKGLLDGSSKGGGKAQGTGVTLFFNELRKYVDAVFKEATPGQEAQGQLLDSSRYARRRNVATGAAYAGGAVSGATAIGILNERRQKQHKAQMDSLRNRTSENLRNLNTYRGKADSTIRANASDELLTKIDSLRRK